MHEQRKSDHIRINLEKDVNFRQLTTGLENYHFLHQALPEIDLAQIDTSVSLLGKTLKAPLLISSMTGGTEQAHRINLTLAEAAEKCGIAMGLGSQRAALENADLAPSFQVRSVAPTAMLLANLGAVQLNYGYSVDHCRRAVEMIEADALILHFNALQEAVQPEGNTNFSGLLAQVEAVCRALEIPVIAKEVGWGFAEDTVRRLAEAGIAAIDVAGSGGTSWTQVEMYRAKSEVRRRVAATFVDWGIPTSEAILAAKRAGNGLPIIASGGLRNGLDMAKCIALGASVAGMAGPFLKAAVNSLQAVLDEIEIATTELRIAMFGIGVDSIAGLQGTERLIKRG
ncbi:MAG: type 2 isopentenyl-diphosphate Delta-isomerase [Anaerolineae bacterium]|nr:type 2 isopentenyl-diphosphate Delta-isomerase [Anaerolineales bacterium]MCQ3973724.1 type 2 isopentenyl-diphosphate Delta-isomerase [Anaerolineae bacterium]